MDESNAILKLSNKKKVGPKLSLEPKVEVQTQLIDSQRLNLQEEQPQELIPQSPTDSKQQKPPEEPKPPQSPSNSKPPEQQSQSHHSHQSIPESPLSQSKINEIIYGSNYGEPAIDNININVNELGNSNIENQDNQGIVPDILDNVGTTPVSVDCPYCNSHIQSNVNSNCNGLTIFLYIMMIIVFPIMCIASIYKAGSGTSRCCMCYGSSDEEGGGSCDCCNDVTHTCPKCGKVLGESDSCSRLFSCI